MAKSWLLGHPVEIVDLDKKGTIVRTFVNSSTGTLMLVVQVEDGRLATVTAHVVRVLDAPSPTK